MPLESLQNGRYRIVRELGRGSMGEVFLVDDTVIGRQVAIKMMLADPAAYPNAESIKDAVRLFKREAQAVARLDHPHILPLYDFGEERGEKTVFTYMVMPHCQAGSLSDWLERHYRNRPLPPAEVATFVEQAAEALFYAHEHGIIHQDVKPSNFLLRTHASGQLLPDLLLADFGIARMGTGTTVTSMSAGPRGTPRYMPPEQWEGKPVPASDQYALAVMAYQLLTLHYPFSGEQMLQLMYQHLQGTPEAPRRWNSDIPPALEAVILRALAKRPGERYPSVQDFARAFRQALPKARPEPSIQTRESVTFETSPMETASDPSAPTRTSSGPSTPVPPVPYYGVQPPQPLRAQFPQQPVGRIGPGYPAEPPVRTFAQSPVTQTVPPTRLPGPPQAQFTPLPPVEAPRHSSRGKAVFLLSLTLLVLLIGGGSFAYYAFLRPPRPQSHRPQVDLKKNPYNSSMSALRFADPLSRSAMWQALPYDQLTDGFCLFQQGAYHASSNKTHVYTLCPASPQQPVTGDMTFEVHMQILHGDCGGLLFRGDFQQGNFYYFDVCFDGHHYLTTYKNFALLQQLPSNSTMFPALQTNAQANVTIAIVARGSSLTFYLDGQQIDQVSDATYTSGQIALLCFAIDRPTEVVFSKARLWTA